MGKVRVAGRRMLVLVVIVLLAGMLACSGDLGTPPLAGGPSAEVAALQKQVAAQATRIAILETKAAAPQAPIAQGTRIALLETQVPLSQTRVAVQPGATQAVPTASGITPTARPTVPTPTMIPAVAGLSAAGNTKGATTAKVTITEYTDYL